MMKKALAVAAIALIAGTAQAASVQNTTGITGATGTIDFSEVALSPGATVTNQYAAYGASFSSFAVFRAQDGFFATDYIGNFGALGTANPFQIVFSSDVDAAAFQFISNPGTTTFEALLDGTVVSSFTASTGTGVGTYYGFQGTTFDTIRITSPVNGAMEMDNLQFQSAVPEPASIALFGLGLFAVGLRARRKA